MAPIEWLRNLARGEDIDFLRESAISWHQRQSYLTSTSSYVIIVPSMGEWQTCALR